MEAARQAALREVAARQAALDAQKKAAEEEQQRQEEEAKRRARRSAEEGVDRRGDLFIHLGRLATTQAIAELLELRVPLLRKMHATVVETPLSKDDTKTVMKQLAGKWSDSPEAQTWVDEASARS